MLGFVHNFLKVTPRLEANFYAFSHVKQSVCDWDSLPLILSVNHLMDIFNISRTKAYQMTNIKGFPAFKIGKQIFIKKEALMIWIENQSNS